MSVNHLVIACGGTGGHFYPTLAIAEEWRKLGNSATLAIAGAHGEEQRRLAEQRGIPAVSFPAVRLPNSLLSALAFPFRFFQGWREARRCWLSLHPDVILGMGSYASVLTCWTRPAGIPLFLHEGNAFMGKANRLFAAKSRGVGLSLPLAFPEQTHGRPAQVVGMPLREQLTEAARHPEPDLDFLPSLGLRNGVPTVLVFGGSQGAKAINGAFAAAAAQMASLRERVQFIHLTGPTEEGSLAAAYAEAGIRASIRVADSRIERCYLASDLVFCRGGASSLCELALFGKPAVMIPLPSSADGHQEHNARLAEKEGGAVALPQSRLAPDVLCELLRDFLDNPGKYRAMGARLRERLARPDAAQAMVRFILDNCGGEKR